MAKTQEKSKPASAQPPEFNWATFWKARRDPEVPVDVNIEKDPQAVRGGMTGHRCPNEGCGKPVTWGNTLTFSYSIYQVICRDCGNAWEMPHKYVWPLVQAAMVVPAAPEATPEAEQPEAADDEVGFLDAE